MLNVNLHKRINSSFVYCFSILILVCSLCMPSQSFAQLYVKPAKQDNLPAPSLTKIFYKHSLFNINPAEIKSYTEKTGKGFSDIILDFEGYPKFPLNIYKHDIIAADYKLVLADESGKKTYSGPGGITFTGMLEQQADSRVYLTLTNNIIFGFIQSGDKKYFIEPLQYILKGANPNTFIVYEAGDVIPQSGISCGVTEAHQKLAQYDFSKETGNPQDATGTCRMVEMAIASDHLMLEKYISVDNLQERNIGILNIMNGMYANAQFGTQYLEFKIKGQFVAASSATNPLSPSYNGTDPSVILQNFTNWGQAGNFGFTYDIGLLWSGRDFDGSTVGLAWVGTTCTSNRYQIDQDFSSSSLTLASLIAHETGHNLNAQHDAGGGFIMAASIQNPPATTFSSGSLAQISNFLTIGGGNCFSTCNAELPIAQFNPSVKNICTGSSITFTDYSVGEVTSRVWSFPDGNPSTSTAISPVVTYATQGPKSATLTVTNAFGSTSITKEVFVANTPITACRTSITGNSQTPVLFAFKLADINHQNDFYFIGGSNRYENFSCTKNTRLLEGTTYPVNITVGFLQLPTYNISNKFELFIDYNNDGDFLDANEAVFTGPNCFQGPNQFSITTPSSVPVKNTWLRLRIIAVACDLPSTNGCAIYANSQTQDFAVYFAQEECVIDDDITGPTNICSILNNTANYSITATGASNFQWTVPANASIVSGQGTNNIQVLFNSNFNAGDISVSIDGCGSQPVTRTLPVSKSAPPLVVENISGNPSVCGLFSGSFENYQIPAVSGANNYQWSVSGGSVFSGQGTPNVLISIIDQFTAMTVSVTVSGCGTSDVVRTFNVSPAYRIIATATAGGTISFPGTAVNCSGQNRTYTITPNACFSIQDVLVDGVSQGPVSSYTFSNINADHTISASFVALSPLSAPVVSGPTNVCPFLGNGQQVTYTAFSNGATTYNWTLPANVNLVSGQGTANLTVTFNAAFATQANKQIRVIASNACYTSPLAIFYPLVQFPSTPAAINASGNNVCLSLETNQPITFTIPKVTAATSYIWTGQAGTTTITHPNGPGVNDTTVTVLFSSNFSTSAITVTAVNDCGASGTRSFTITRANPSTPGLISGPTNVCAFIGTNSPAATYSVPLQSNVSTYSWTLPNGATGITGQGTNTVSFNFPNGYAGGAISVIAVNGCGSSTTPRSLNLATLNPATPGIIDVIQTQSCPNRVYTYSVSNMPSNAASVQWSVPVTSGAQLLSGQGTTSITVSYPSTAVSGNITAVAQNNCGSSTTRVLAVKLPACAPEFAKGSESNTVAGDQSVEGLSALVYPNPAMQTASLKLQSPDAQSMVTVRVIDLQGAVRQRKTMMPNSLLSLGDGLPSGQYLVEIVQGRKRVVQKFTKL